MFGLEFSRISLRVFSYFPTHWIHSYSRIILTNEGFHALQRKSDLCTPRKETARSLSQFPHSCICEGFTYSHDPIGPPLGLQPNRQIDRGNISLTEIWIQENWAWGRAVSFLGILVSNFRYTVFAVRVPYSNLTQLSTCRHFLLTAFFRSNKTPKSLFLKNLLPVFSVQLIAGAKWMSMPLTAGPQSPRQV
jgi:hypothetical protein